MSRINSCQLFLVFLLFQPSFISNKHEEPGCSAEGRVKPCQGGMKLGNVAPAPVAWAGRKKSSKMKQFGGVSEPKEPEMKRFFCHTMLILGHRVTELFGI